MIRIRGHPSTDNKRLKMIRQSLHGAIFVVLLALSVADASAQADDAEHPILSDRFLVAAGIFFPDKDFEVTVNGNDPGQGIDFDEAFKVDKSESTGALTLRWRFGEKWEIQGQYWTTSDSGTALLEEDLYWRDVVLEAGTFASARAGIDIARIFFGRRFSTGPSHEFGAGIGLHWLQIKASIEGQIMTNLGDTEVYRSAAEADLPLPNIGAWYTYAWSPKWALVSRVDWLSASIGDYSGGLWNAQLGVNWAVFRNFGVTASYNYFQLDGDVTEDTWNGSVKTTQNGPFLALTANW